MGTQDQGAEHCQTRRAAGALPDLCLAGLHKAHTVQRADLAVVDLVRLGVLVHIDPVRVAAQVIGHIRVDDAHKAGADGVSVHGLQLGGRTGDQVAGQLAGRVQGGAAGHSGLRAAFADLGRIDHIGAARQHITHDGVQGAARLAGNDLGCLQDVVINGGQLQRVGNGHPAAVLPDFSGNGGNVHGLAVRGHTLGQRSGGLGQAVILAEFDVLAAVGRNGIRVAELVMHQGRLCLVDQALLVKGFHLGTHAGCAGGVLVLGAGRCKHLQIQLRVLGSVVHSFLLKFIFLYSRLPY